MENFDLKKYLAENRLLKENVSPEELWPEWAQGEKEVGNDEILDGEGNILDFSDAEGELKEVFMEYVKAVQGLGAENGSPELRGDIAAAVSLILYDGPYFEDLEVDVLSEEQFDKIVKILEVE
jgi:hypothetical protein